MTKEILTQEKLKEHLHYDELSGKFTWLKITSNRVKTGSEAGIYDKKSNRFLIRLNGILYLSHRLAWLYMTGEFPRYVIDHINGNSQDNRFCNLRDCTQMQNTWNAKIRKNNTSGYKGISWSDDRKKWVVMIKAGGKYRLIGRFKDIKDAIYANNKFRNELHGEFCNYG